MAHWVHIEFHNSVSHMATAETDRSGLCRITTRQATALPSPLLFPLSALHSVPYWPRRGQCSLYAFLWVVSHWVPMYLKRADSTHKVASSYGMALVITLLMHTRSACPWEICKRHGPHANSSNHHRGVVSRNLLPTLQEHANKHLQYHIANVFSPFGCYRILEKLFRLLHYADKNVSCAT